MRVYFSLFFCLCISLSHLAVAEPITIGAEWDGNAVAYESGDHPFSWIVRTLVLPGLTTRKSAQLEEGTGYRLVLADSMKTSADSLFWYFRLSAGQRFSSGASLTVEDVKFSIERCQERGVLAEVKRVFEPEERKKGGEVWVGFELDASTANDVPFELFPEALADCAIMQSDISKLFGERAGRRLTVVGAGPFAVTEFDLKRKQLELKRIYSFKGEVHPLSIVVLKGVASERDGLSALRSGAVDILVGQQREIRTLALADETLRLSQCNERLLVYRTTLQVACTPDIDFESLRYER